MGRGRRLSNGSRTPPGAASVTGRRRSPNPHIPPEGALVAATLTPGTTVELDEDDYLYGTGRLTLRITRVGGYVTAQGCTWRRVSGVELWWDGTEAGEREVLVRVLARAHRG